MSNVPIYLFCVAFFATVTWTVTWFWSSTVMMPLLQWTFSYQEVLSLVAVYHIFWNFTRLLIFYRSVNWRLVAIWWVPSVAYTAMGAYMAGTDTDIFKMVLALALVWFVIYTLLKPSYLLPRNSLFGTLWWWLAGFTSGIMGTWGVLRWALMQWFRLSKESYIATLAVIALAVDFTRVPIYLAKWYFEGHNITIFPILFLIALLWSWIWWLIVKKLSIRTFRNIIYVAIILVNIKLFYDGYVGLF